MLPKSQKIDLIKIDGRKDMCKTVIRLMWNTAKYNRAKILGLKLDLSDDAMADFALALTGKGNPDDKSKALQAGLTMDNLKDIMKANPDNKCIFYKLVLKDTMK